MERRNGVLRTDAVFIVITKAYFLAMRKKNAIAPSCTEDSFQKADSNTPDNQSPYEFKLHCNIS